MLKIDPRDRENLIEPLLHFSSKFWIVAALLLMLVILGVMAYVQQVQMGLGETGMQRPAYWGIYMTNFVFFIGISLAGTFISAILNLIGADWRRPITRIAEAVTVFALIVAAIQIVIDMGRPDRLLYVFLYGRLQSPILWDVLVVTLYLLSSLFYLYLPLIPDAALLRDNMPEHAPFWRHLLYRILALGWRGNIEQWRRLEKAISLMSLVAIPIAVSVHTITSWILATTVQPGWHSTVFGPYFVVTAVFSGISGLFLAMTAVRRVFHLEEYITLQHYRNLGLLFITMSIIWGYFTYAESLTLAAGQQKMEFPVLASKLWGQDAPGFWIMLGLIGLGFWIMMALHTMPKFIARIRLFQPRITFGFAVIATGIAALLSDPELVFPGADIPPLGSEISLTLVILAGLSAIVGISVWSKQHPIGTTLVAGTCVLAGTWIERWNIVVPTVTHPRLIPYSSYAPTAIELVLTIGSVALMFLGLVVFFKLFPPVPIWEVQEGRVIEDAHGKLEIPVPKPSNPQIRKRRWQFR